MTTETIDCFLHNLAKVGVVVLFVGAFVAAVALVILIGSAIQRISDNYEDWRSWAYPALAILAIILTGTLIYTSLTC